MALINPLLADKGRRNALKVVTGAFGAGAALLVGAPVIGALIAPASRRTVKGADDFVPVADMSALPNDGTPIAVVVVVRDAIDAWAKMPPTQVGTVFVRKATGHVEVFSSVCPHLGCRIDFDSKNKRFSCPCHDSTFELDGAVHSGPSPRPMDHLETRIAEGRIEIKFQRFEAGTEERRPV